MENCPRSLDSSDSVTNAQTHPATASMMMSQDSQDISSSLPTVDGDAESAAVSKRSLKKLAKKAKWEENKKLKRLKTQLKRKEKKRCGGGDGALSRKALKQKTMKNSSCRTHIVIDLSFDHLMSEKDLGKVVKQIHRCYSVNRRQTNPVQFHVTSFVGESAKMMEKHDGFSNWDIFFHKESYDEIFQKDSLVYLTSDSEHVAENLEEDKFYIIGGLVDHNSKKGLCHNIAIEKNLKHARLPIDKFIEMKTRQILSIDHVFEIMANVCQGVSWQDSFMRVIPPRKNAALKQPAGQQQEDNNTSSSSS